MRPAPRETQGRLQHIAIAGVHLAPEPGTATPVLAGRGTRAFARAAATCSARLCTWRARVRTLRCGWLRSRRAHARAAACGAAHASGGGRAPGWASIGRRRQLTAAWSSSQAYFARAGAAWAVERPHRQDGGGPNTAWVRHRLCLIDCRRRRPSAEASQPVHARTLYSRRESRLSLPLRLRGSTLMTGGLPVVHPTRAAAVTAVHARVLLVAWRTRSVRVIAVVWWEWQLHQRMHPPAL